MYLQYLFRRAFQRPVDPKAGGEKGVGHPRAGRGRHASESRGGSFLHGYSGIGHQSGNHGLSGGGGTFEPGAGPGQTGGRGLCCGRADDAFRPGSQAGGTVGRYLCPERYHHHPKRSSSDALFPDFRQREAVERISCGRYYSGDAYRLHRI